MSEEIKKEQEAPEAEESVKAEAAEETAAEPAEKPTEPEKESAEEEKADKKESRKEKKAREKAGKEAAEEEKKAADDRYLRLAAEYDNYRRRTQKEKDDLYALVKKNTVYEFLPVYDNLARALDASTEDEAYKKGVQMIMDQFLRTLEKLGVTKIESLGKTFDPNVHNAVMHVDDEEKGENEIVQVFQEGFMVGDKVIRTAMVKVAN